MLGERELDPEVERARWRGPRSSKTYSERDDLTHIRWLAEAFSDPRYLRVRGRPVFLVYRATSIPDAARTTDAWRRESVRLGAGDPYLVLVHSFDADRLDPGPLGFDAAVKFAPDWRMVVVSSTQAAGTVGFGGSFVPVARTESTR